MFEILFTNLEEFHQKLNKLQQLEDELKNNVRKMHWVGHVQKTIMTISRISQTPSQPLGKIEDSL